MKHTLLLRTIVICLASSLMAGSTIARQASSSDNSSSGSTGNFGTSTTDAGQPPAPSSSTLSSSSSGSMRSERLSQVMGATVKDQQGNTIGQINDFVVNPTSGRLQFAIISLNDQSGKLTAVPWQLVRPGSDPTTCTLSISKSKLDNAQTFDASSWPDFGQTSTTQQIYSHYGVQPMGHMGNQGGTSGGNYYNSGRGESQQQSPQDNQFNSQGNQGSQQSSPQSNP